jgi:hypothetical protein
VTKTGGVAFTGLATAAIPLSVANGGTGSTTVIYAPLTNAGANNYAPISSPTLTGITTTPQLLLSNTTTTQIFFGSSTTPTGAIGSVGSDDLTLYAGMHYNGTTWIADATTAQTESINNQGFDFYQNTGLTVGSSFTPKLIAQVASAGLVLQTSPSAGWTLDATGVQATVATGGSFALPVGAGMIVVTDTSVSGETAMYVCGSAACGLAMTSHSGIGFVASTTTPASGKSSVASNGTAYAIYNNTGSTVTYGLALFETRNAL